MLIHVAIEDIDMNRIPSSMEGTTGWGTVFKNVVPIQVDARCNEGIHIWGNRFVATFWGVNANIRPSVIVQKHKHKMRRRPRRGPLRRLDY